MGNSTLKNLNPCSEYIETEITLPSKSIKTKILSNALISIIPDLKQEKFSAKAPNAVKIIKKIHLMP
jgi:hypothetical protein